MWLPQWIRGMWYSGYDRRGNLKYLEGRSVDASQSDVHGVPREIRDEALTTFCEAFDIPDRQMYCLREDDQLMAIYRSQVGPRFWDNFQFERLMLSLGKLPGGKVSVEDAAKLKTVGDVVSFVAVRRGIGRRRGDEPVAPSIHR